MKDTKLFELVTGTEMKPWLSRNMLPNINTCENRWSNFSANLRVVSLKLLELSQFAWPNLSIYSNFLCALPRDDVIESTRFLMRPPVNHSTMICTAPKADTDVMPHCQRSCYEYNISIDCLLASSALLPQHRLTKYTHYINFIRCSSSTCSIN